MHPDADFEPVEMTERFFTVINSLNQFDKAELRGIVKMLIGEKTDREICKRPVSTTFRQLLDSVHS